MKKNCVWNEDKEKKTYGNTLYLILGNVYLDESTYVLFISQGARILWL